MREEPEDEGDLSDKSGLLFAFEGRLFNSAVGVKELLELECERKKAEMEWGILYFQNAPLDGCEAVRLLGKVQYDGVVVVHNLFLKFSKAGWNSSERQPEAIETVLNESKNGKQVMVTLQDGMGTVCELQKLPSSFVPFLPERIRRCGGIGIIYFACKCTILRLGPKARKRWPSWPVTDGRIVSFFSLARRPG
jgi:hypothetical protein